MDRNDEVRKREEDRKTITFVLTQACNLRCKYCYMIHKEKKRRMSFDTAKTAVDFALSQRDDPTFAMTGVVWEFIGGEPLLEIDLITQIIEYAKRRMYELNHPWFAHSMFNVCSNGVLYDDPRVQDLVRRYKTQLDIGITIDGTKRMHDTARVFPDGSGSYDRIVKNIPLWQEQFPRTGTKVTIAHENLPFVAEAVLHLFDLGIATVHANVVFENVWQPGDDALFERQLDILGDAIIERRIWETCDCSLFSRQIGQPIPKDQDTNWCGAGKMLAVDSEGLLYPCVRFLEFTLTNKPPIVLGNIQDGVDRKKLEPFLKLTRSSQSPSQCMECEVASGCAWCQGFNYDDAPTDTINKRAIYICPMHKARVRANGRFWDKIDALEAMGVRGDAENRCTEGACPWAKGGKGRRRRLLEDDMIEELCGKVTQEECDEIKELFMRKNALAELFLVLAKLEAGSLNPLYEKVVKDMGETAHAFHGWWDKKAAQYGWKGAEGGNWRIDFQTCEVYLVR